MAVLSANQLAAYAANAGFSGNAITQIVAKALAESSGNTDAVNRSSTEGRQGSWGVLQINADAHGLGVAQSALDPQTAFNLAYRISNGGTDFSPWHAQPTPSQYAQAAQASANLNSGGTGLSGITADTNLDNYAYFGQTPPTSVTPQQLGTASDYGYFGLPDTNGNYVDANTPTQSNAANYGAFGMSPPSFDATNTTGTTSTPSNSTAGISSALTGLSTTLSTLVTKLTDPATWQRTALIVLGITVLVAALFLFGFSMVENARPAHA